VLAESFSWDRLDWGFEKELQVDWRSGGLDVFEGGDEDEAVVDGVVGVETVHKVLEVCGAPVDREPTRKRGVLGSRSGRHGEADVGVVEKVVERACSRVGCSAAERWRDGRSGKSSIHIRKNKVGMNLLSGFELLNDARFGEK
jgi:hypothetical protein